MWSWEEEMVACVQAFSLPSLRCSSSCLYPKAEISLVLLLLKCMQDAQKYFFTIGKKGGLFKWDYGRAERRKTVLPVSHVSKTLCRAPSPLATWKCLPFPRTVLPFHNYTPWRVLFLLLRIPFPMFCHLANSTYPSRSSPSGNSYRREAWWLLIFLMSLLPSSE